MEAARTHSISFRAAHQPAPECALADGGSAGRKKPDWEVTAGVGIMRSFWMRRMYTASSSGLASLPYFPQPPKRLSTKAESLPKPLLSYHYYFSYRIHHPWRSLSQWPQLAFKSGLDHFVIGETRETAQTGQSHFPA